MRFLKSMGNLVPTSPLTKENLKWTSETYDYIPGDLDAYICVGMGFSFVHLMAFLMQNWDDRMGMILFVELPACFMGILDGSDARDLVSIKCCWPTSDVERNFQCAKGVCTEPVSND